jgi:LysR family transcriptional regulator, hca operon transcriptional activator
MELRHLRYFVAVAEELNFTRAARRLHTAQPSLSHQIRQLEEYVGTALLERNRRRVQLTNAGRVFLRESRDILKRIDLAVDRASRALSSRTAELSIGVSPPAEVRVMPKILPLMQERLPLVTLTLHSLLSANQIAGLRDYTIDLGLLRGPLDEPELTTKEILRENLVVVLPSNHRLAKTSRISIRMLDDLPCVTFSRGAFPLRNIVASLYKQEQMRIRSVQEADSVLGHLNMVAAGLGFALLPEYVESMLPRGVIVRPLDYHPMPSISLVAAYRTNDKLPALHAFMELLDHCFTGRTAAALAPRRPSRVRRTAS